MEPTLFPPPDGPLSALTKPVAMLRFDPPQLTKYSGLHFQAGWDDLDTLEWAEVVGLSGKRYALVRHRNAPNSGTEILIRHDSSDPYRDLQDVLQALRLDNSDLTWKAPEVTERRSVSTRKTQYQIHLAPRKRRKTARPPALDVLRRKIKQQIPSRAVTLSEAELERVLTHFASSTKSTHIRKPPRSAARKASKKR